MSAADFTATTLETAMANVTAGTQQQVVGLNTALQADYLVLFNNWAQRVIAGQAPEINPPQPPDAYIVGYFIDSTNSTARWAYPVSGNQPVCVMPPLPVLPQTAPPAPPPAGTASAQVGSKQNVPVGDTMPLGYKATAPDGAVWQKMASLTPFGTAYYYERVA
jgi:hypothetical protein